MTSTIRVITTTTTRTRYHASHDHRPSVDSEETSLNGEVMPYRSQPRCDHLLPTDPSVQEAEGVFIVIIVLKKYYLRFLKPFL